MQIAFRVKLIWNNFTQSANSHPISFPPSCVWIYADFPLDDQTWLSNHGIILIVGKVTSRPNLWAWLVQSVQQTILLLAPLQHNTRRMLVLPNSNEVCVEFGGEIWIFQKRSAWKTTVYRLCQFIDIYPQYWGTWYLLMIWMHVQVMFSINIIL